MNELTTIWFYTLSTSAQVLAALVGLFAIFVVYKLQGLNPALEDVRAALIKILPYISSNINNFGRRNTIEELDLKSDRELISIFDEILEVQKTEPQRLQIKSHPIKSGLFPEKYYDLNNQTKTYYETKAASKQDILSRLKKSLIFGFVLITFCVLELSFTMYLIDIKVLFLTSVAVAVYMMLIIKNVYLISTS